MILGWKMFQQICFSNVHISASPGDEDDASGDVCDDGGKKDREDEIVYKKDGGIHGAPMGAVHSMYYAKVWWGENTAMHIMQYKKYKIKIHTTKYRKCNKNKNDDIL